jgi:hypothetical protein
VSNAGKYRRSSPCQQLGADLKPGALCGGVLDGESQLAVLGEELGDAAEFGEPVDIAERQDGHVAHGAEQLRPCVVVTPET